MLGAIAGDICASPWEGGSCARKDFELFSAHACLTDDTVCTVAIADALLTGKDYAAALREWVLRNPGRGYGGLFRNWATSLQGPYGSYGNGGAMRVSPAGLLASSLEEAEALAKATSDVTHNHPEGVKGSQAIAVAVWLALRNERPTIIRAELQRRFGYDLSKDVHQLERAGFGFSTLAEETVPIALVSALESTSWQNAVENTVAIGGDSDTLACMAGGIAEAMHGLPMAIAIQALEYLSTDMVEVLNALYQRAGRPLPWMTETARPVSVPVVAEPESPEIPRSWLSRLFGRR